MFLSLFNGGGPKADAGDGDRSPFGNFWFQPLGLRTASGVRVTADSALALPAVWSAVRVLSESFAVMPFQLNRISADGKTRTLQRNHWLFRLLAKRPNRWQSPYFFKLMLMGHLVLRGNAYCQIISNSAGEIVEALPLHPDRMSVDMLPSGDYRYRYLDQNGVSHVFTRGEIWHLRGLSDDGIMGLSPIACEREALGEGLALQQYSSRFFANDAKPGGGWIEYPGSFRDQDTKNAWRDSWQKMQGGSNRHKVAVLERGMKFHELGLNNVDSQFIEARGFKISDIARIFRVPPHMIGDLSRATFSNIEQQSIDFWTGTMLPYCELWESSIEFDLLGLGLDGPDEDLEPEFDMDRMMRGDAVSRGTYYGLRTQWGSITPNEVRARENEEPLPWLDYTMRPVNMARLDANGESNTILPGGGQEPEDPTDSELPSDPEPSTDPTSPPRKQAAYAMAVASVARIKALVTGNARRMARRIAAGNTVPADQLAEAMAIDDDTAVAWLAGRDAAADEDTVFADLMGLALENRP